jgi:hypothetical protein
MTTCSAASLTPGSYLALSHLARDVEGEALAETFRRLNAVMAESVSLRSRKEVADCSAGWSW